MNRYSTWKYIMILILIGIGIIYALPNIYGKDPALQISPGRSGEMNELVEYQVTNALDEAGISYKAVELNQTNIIVRFKNEDTQLKAQDIVKKEMGANYTVALNLAPATPAWLDNFAAEPMFLGLDLRGGVHFLMEIDMEAAMAKAEERYISDIRSQLRENKIRYKTVSSNKDGGILLRFRDAADKAAAEDIINNNFSELDVIQTENIEEPQLIAKIQENVVQETKRLALQQNITTLRKRVNELGVAEPVIQQQGLDRIVVQLPGVQDTARAKETIGATATLEFRLVDDDHSPQDAVDGKVPAGSKLYYERSGFPILLDKQVMLTGESIIDAASGIDGMTGGPSVTIRLDGAGANRMQHGTRDNVGKRLAVVFIESKSDLVEENGEMVQKKETIEEVINSAVIKEQLGARFQITGLDSSQEAKTLALLLRAGALAAPVYIVEERTVGPSLGQDNIDQGFKSVMIGFAFVLIFMAIYYKAFGLIANVALTLNLVLIVALLSMLQATLTMPGIAGIVLTVGMAVDANVLIYERIKEEIRNGNSPQASIYSGYEKAFSTIADANITTLIAAVVLFGFGTGPIQGFAVTLSLGILSSMFTAIMVTRALVNLIYGGRRLDKIRI